MPNERSSPAGPMPAGVERPCAHLDEVLAFHAQNGGHFFRSLELEHATRGVTRAWLASTYPLRGLQAWLRCAAANAVPDRRLAAALASALQAWAVDECLVVRAVVPRTGCLTPDPSSPLMRSAGPRGAAAPRFS